MVSTRGSRLVWDSALTDIERDAGLALHPVWYIVVNRAWTEQIRATALTPVHDPRQCGAPWADDERPWIYLAARWAVPVLYTACDVDEHNAALLAIDLRGIDPRRIRPDEMQWADLDEAEFESSEDDIARPRPGQNPADWADEIRLGEQPPVSAVSLAAGRIAVRGYLTPDRVTVVDQEPGTTLKQWERAHLSARPSR